MTAILLCEDDALLARLYEKKFKQDGYAVRVCGDGEKGLAAIRDRKPDLILLDIMMPNMNGLEMLKVMKASPETKNIPVIMLTNLSSKAEVEKSLELGAVAYLVKAESLPVVVVAKVKEVLAATTRGREIPKAVATGQ